MTVPDADLEQAVAALLAGDQDVVRNPYPVYQRMRDLGPVYWHKSTVPFVTRHAEAKASLLDDQRLLTRRGQERFKMDSLSEDDRQRVREIVAFEALQLSGMNGAIHQRVRSAAIRGFTPSRIAHLGDYAKKLANDFLDDLAKTEESDLVKLSYRLPLLALMELLGAPRDDADMLKSWGDDLAAVKQYVPGGVPSDKIRKAHAGIANVRGYAAKMVEHSRRNPGNVSLVSALIEAQDNGRISEDELTGTLVVILYAGHLTTTDLIGSGIHDMLVHRDQWERLCADPSLAKSAVEETLRFNAPVQMMVRMPNVDVEIAGHKIAAGTNTMILYASANRDPAVFKDPDRMDIGRTDIDHLSFGKGVHVCIGSSLARLEAQAVYDTVCRRFPDMRLAEDPSRIEWNAHPMFHGLKRLPVHLGRDRGRTA